jgi:hypothetical protein
MERAGEIAPRTMHSPYHGTDLNSIYLSSIFRISMLRFDWNGKTNLAADLQNIGHAPASIAPNGYPVFLLTFFFVHDHGLSDKLRDARQAKAPASPLCPRPTTTG